MAELDPLKFAVAIQDEATGELNKIEQRLKNLKDQTIKIDVAGLEGLDRLLKSIGHDSNGITIKLPDLSQFTEQVKSVKNVTESLFSKQNWGDIPVFTSALSQIKELTAAVDKLKSENLAVITGHGTDFYNKLQQMGTAMSAAFQEVPNVKIQSMLSFMKQFEQEYSTFLTKLQSRGLGNFSQESSVQIERLQRQFNQLQSIGGDATALKQFQQQVRTIAAIITESIGNVIKEIGGVKNAIQHDNFSAFTNRINNAAEAMDKLTQAFDKFNLTVGKDEGLKNFMTGLGEVIRNVRTTMNQLEGGKMGLGSNQSDIYLKNVQKMQDALFRIQEARAKVGVAIKDGEAVGMNVSGMKIYLQLLDSYEKKLQNIRSNPFMMHENGWQSTELGTTFKTMLSNAGDFQKQVDAYIQKQNTLETNQRRYNIALEESEKLMQRLDNASTRGFNLGVDTSKTDRALQDIQQFIDKLLMFDKKDLGNRHAVNELIAEYTRLKSTLSGVAREQEKLNASTDKANKKASDNAAKKAQKENEQWAESMRRAGVEATKLEIQVRKLHDAESRGKLANVDTVNLSARIAELQSYISILRSIESGSKLHGHTNDFINSVPYQNAIRLANEEAAAVRKSATEKEQAARATQQLSAEEQRLSQALQQTSESAKGQSQILSDLKSLATQYLGVWGGQQFLHNIIEIGGQLEMQRLSIGAILQNTAQANELFDKIKRLATQSPFGVVQLDQMTKQLTAYGFQYSELYDMTKRLADISAATGTDVGRLALALGHVRAEAALSGYTLRQFAMGNVPLLQKLSEKLGKTTKEIREMARAKQISYEDVVGVLKDLTDEGGMFYNMQEVISESVKAKFKNVKDAMDIMYGEMAEGAPGDALKVVAEALMEVTKNWKDAATVLGTGTALWGIHKVAVLAYTKVLGTANAATLSSIAAFRQKEAAQLRSASLYRTLTSAEKSQIATSRLLTTQERIRMALHIPLTNAQKLRIQYARQQHVMDLALAVSEKKLTTEDIARQVALGKLTKAEAVQIISLADLTAAERAAALSAIHNTKVLGFWGKAGYAAALGIKALGTALKSLIFNPAMIAMAGITAIMELWQRNKQEMERAGEIADSIRERSNSAMQATKNVINSSQMEFTDSNGKKVSPSRLDFQSIATIRAKMTVEFDKEEAQQLIDEWSEYIRQYSATPNKILNEALFDGDKMRSTEEQFKRIGEAMSEIVKAQYGLHDMGDVFENATKATDDGWFNDDIVSNINDYEEAVKDYKRAFSDLYREHGKGVDKIVKSVEQQNSAFENAVSGMNTYAEKFKYLIENMGQFTGAYGIARNAVEYSDKDLYDFLYDSQYGNFSEKGELNWAKSNMDEDLETFFTHIEAELNNKGQKIGELTQAQQQDLLLGFTDFLSKTKVTSTETLDYLKKKFAERFKLKLDADDEKFKVKVSESLRMLKELSESEWNTDLKFATNINDVIDEARKQYKAAKEFYEKADPVLVKFGVEMKMGDVLTEEQIQEALKKAPANARNFLEQVLRGANEASRLFNQANTASESGGFSLEDKKKTKPTGDKSYKDEFAKRWDERIRIMKEAYDWYTKWEKKVGNDAAIAETNSKYADIFNEWKTDKLLPMDFDVNAIADYTKYVKQIRDDALRRYQTQKNDKSKNNGQEALRVYRQAVALLNDVKFDNFTNAAERFKSLIEKAMDDLQRKWSIFNEVRNATGSTEIASHLLGMNGDDMAAQTTANATRKLIETAIGNMGEAVKVPIRFDVNMSDMQIKDNVTEALGGTEYQEQIDSIVEALKKWRDLQRDVIKEDILNYAKLIGSAVDYESQVKKINDELERTKAGNARLVEDGTISQSDADKANKIAETQAEDKKWKLSIQYVTLMNSSLAMTREQVENGVNMAMEHLNALLKQNLITAKEYADEMEHLRNILSDWDKNALFGENNTFTSFLKGGIGGLENYYKGQLKWAETILADKTSKPEDLAKAQNIENKYGGDDGALAKLQNFSNKLSGVALVSEAVMGAFDGLQKAANDLSQMFDALGNEGAANFWSDFSDTVGGISSIFAPVNNLLSSAMSGNVSGLISSAISAPVSMITGPITAFSQLHDKRIERAINKLREDVQRIEANTKLIQQARSRTLGFDYGDVRRSYAEKYAKNDKVINIFGKKYEYKSAAQQAMYDYYRKNSGGTGYQQEYQNLQDERQKYIDMYNAENGKKKSSAAALEEYKAKIAELDDQIRYFTMDLANELFSIDIKGWADQLSDALCSAFENGESMAKAYKETVTNILQQVMSKMMQLAILEPMFQSLQDKLFGNREKNISGVFNPNDPKGSMAKVTAMITDFFGKGGEGEKTITAAMEFMTAYQRGLENAGLSVKNESANTLSSGIQGTSEETSDLLAGYVNALRQDVAINRIMLSQFVTELWPSYIEQVANAVRSLNNIDANVAFIRTLLSENGALYIMIESMKSHFDAITNGNERVRIQ